VEVPPVPNPEDFVDIGDFVDSDEDASVYEDAQENQDNVEVQNQNGVFRLTPLQRGVHY
jgi:hypothetical protein